MDFPVGHHPRDSAGQVSKPGVRFKAHGSPRAHGHASLLRNQWCLHSFHFLVFGCINHSDAAFGVLWLQAMCQHCQASVLRGLTSDFCDLVRARCLRVDHGVIASR